MIIWKEFTFDSAHFLPNVPPGHKCGRMHGHTFKVRIEVSGDPSPSSGWVMDFWDIKSVVNPVIDQVDHNILNNFPGLENPTSENLALWFWLRIKPKLEMLSAVEVQETCNCGARHEE